MSTTGQTSINYYKANEESIDYVELKANLNGHEYDLISGEVSYCFSIEEIADFNKNGYDDVLVKISEGCSGTCCGHNYCIYSFNGKEFKKSKTIGYDWNGIEVKEANSVFTFLVESLHEGLGNTTYCLKTKETYRFDKYDFELIDFIDETKIEAITEIESSDFKGCEDEELSLYFDLDGDQKLDTFYCKYWFRWGNIGQWKIEFGNGNIYEGASNPKRIGVLSSKSCATHDLVIDCDTVLKWDGDSYQEITGEK